MADVLAGGAQFGAVDLGATLHPLPKRLGQAGPAEDGVGDPVAFVDELLERAGVLVTTLSHDVEHLQADQEQEQSRIQAEYADQQEALEDATDRLGRLRAAARELAVQKGKADLLDAALRLGPQVTAAAPGEAPDFPGLVAELERELRAARGITGGLRIPEIGRLLNDAALAVAQLSQQADHTKDRLLGRTEDELTAEGKEALASFEIGLGVLTRDLELLHEALGASARRWDDPAWAAWEPPERIAPAWIRLGRYVAPDLAGVDLPALMPVTGAPGLFIEGGTSRDEALAVVRNVVLRILAALPPGAARFSFIDPKGLGEAVAPFLGLGEYDPALVSGGVKTLDREIEDHLAELARHVERVTGQHLQGRYASLDELHEAAGEVVEPYHYLVILDHPTGFSEGATRLLRSLIESGPRAGVTAVVVKEGAARGRFGANQSLPDLAVIRSGGERDPGLLIDSSRAGRWRLEADDLPLLTTSDSGEMGLFERITTATGALARQARRRPVTMAAAFDLLARAQRKRVRDDIAATAAPVDPGEPATWWSGDAGTGLGVPIGRTDDRALASLWLDHTVGGALVLGPQGPGVRAVLDAVVTGLAVLYPTEELQLLLVGLGARRELAAYGGAQLPHALVVATRAERELGLAVLEAAARELDRRSAYFEAKGTDRLGLAGHRARTGERVGRLLVVVDGVAELFTSDDPLAVSARRRIERLVEEGPRVGVHVLLAERGSPAELDALLAELPTELTMIHVGDAGGEGETSDAASMVPLGADGATVRFRVVASDGAERALTLRDLRRLADAQGLSARPQVVLGDQGADLGAAPLARLVGEPDRQADRRVVRLWLGEPAALGAPVEVVLRRQEGANLVVVAADPAAAGALFGALTTAVVGNGNALDARVVDLAAADLGFSEAVTRLSGGGAVQLHRRRELGRVLREVGELVADRHKTQVFDAAPCLLVINGLARARDLDADAPAPVGDDGVDSVEVLTAILRDGPEVGVHALIGCESRDLLERRLGRGALRPFALRVGGPMSDDDSTAVLDSAYGSTLRAPHLLLADDERGRLVKLRPYQLPGTPVSLPDS